MKIPFFSKKEQKEFYLGIFLKEDQGVLMIFLKESDRLELVDREKFTYTNGWENLTDDIDEALYKLEKNLESEIKKTIVFVYSHLVDEKIGDIKPVYLQKIKQLVKALELQAMGYVECFEAICYYLEKNEQSSLTAILIEIDKTQLGIFAYKRGKLEAKKVLSRTDNIIADLSEGFEEIKKKTMLPARIILYDSGSLDDTATKILSYRWNRDSFVQIPKVDILSEDEIINGLMGIFGEQLKNQLPAKKEEKVDKVRRETFGFILDVDVREKTMVAEEKNVFPKENSKNILKELAFKFMSFLPKKNPINFKLNISNKIIPIIGLLIIITAFFINEYFFHKANLTVFLPTQVIEKTTKIDVNYRIASASANFSESIQTSGKQDVGDKARGTVTVHNFDDNEKIFSKNSVLSSAVLKFLLDSDVKVASASIAVDGSAKLPGKNTGTVTATIIGQEGNLSKSQRFVFDGLSSSTFFAINEAAFSGGTKKQVQTVAKKDQDDLKATILRKAKTAIPSIKVLPGEIIVSSLSKVDFSKINFSKEIGEEGSSLTLKATVSVTQFLYDKNFFVDKVLTLFQPEVKDDYRLDKGNILYTTDKVNLINNSLIISAKIKEKAVLRITNDEIKKSVLGKNQSKVKEILRNKFKIDGYNLLIEEPLPFLKNFLPFFQNNINLKNSSL